VWHDCVVRRGLAWLSALPLILAGSQAAHVLAYRWVYPDAHVRLAALLSSGHAYMDKLPLVLGLAGAVAAVSLVSAVVQAARGRRVLAVPPAAFAVLPLAAFTLQEILERSLHSSTFVWQAVEAPTFLPGLALQLPVAVVVFAVARFLLRIAERVGRRLALRPPIVSVRPTRSALPSCVDALSPRPLACRLAKRGPPLLAA
jgi:hypothetical protein